MSGLPTGTVSFLFTDIEGSTLLLQHLGARYAEVLTAYRGAIRGEVRARGGQEIDTAGDSVFVVFTRAHDAVTAAVHAQRAILRRTWPQSAPLLVRMAVHTGEPTVAGSGYVGLDVHRAARICAAAHGGQILLSQMTADLIAANPPEGIRLRDLSAHRLKDLRREEHLFQVVHPDLPDEFPPLRSLNTVPNNLPIQLSSLIGREEQITLIKRLLAAHRQVTLTGVGGAGKTRLAIQVGAEVLEEFSEGVWLVELAGIFDPMLVLQSVAAALGVREEMGGLSADRVEPSRSLLQTLTDYLQPKQLLLIVDNCEHLIGAAAQLCAGVLRACPRLRVLATSREALGLAGEVVWPVPPLTLPEPSVVPALDTLVQYPAVRLFAERAVAVRPQFTLTRDNAPAIVQICQRLDGIPLAIELAAARVRVLSPAQIASRLDNRFGLLTGGGRTALPHQQTLQAAMDWSYDLLAEPERMLFRRLAVFASGFTLEAVEAICAGDGIDGSAVLDLLARLIDKSLVIAEQHNGRVRYRMLDTVRQYSLRKLQEAGEEPTWRGRHRDWYLAMVERAEPLLHTVEQDVWLERLEIEQENLQTAMEWSLSYGEVEAGLRLVGTQWWFWHVRGYFTAGRELAENALARSEGASPAAGAKACVAAALLAWAQSDYEHAIRRGQEGLALARQSGNAWGIGGALTVLGLVAHRQADYARAVTLYEESRTMAKQAGDVWIEAMDLLFLGEISVQRGQYDMADRLYTEGLALFRRLGDKSGIAYGLFQAGLLARRQREYARATTLFDESLAMFRALGNRGGMAYALNMLGRVAYGQDDLSRAGVCFEESVEISRELGYKSGLAYSLYQSGLAALRQGNHDLAAVRFAESLQLRHALGNGRGTVECLEGLAMAAGAQGQLERAARLVGVAESLRAQLQLPPSPDERAEIERALATARAGSGAAACEAARSEGRTAPLDQAVSYALNLHSDSAPA